MKLLENKKALITGIASDRSIAYGIAKAFKLHGADLILTYQNERFKPRVERVAEEFGIDKSQCLMCDVASDESLNELAQDIRSIWPDGIDSVVHSIGYAPRDQIEGSLTENASREGFQIAHDISSYSFIGLTKALRPLINPNGSLITLSYMGAEKAVPNYNMMGLAKASLEAAVRYLANDLGPSTGIRVNAISAGPIRTLAASGIQGFRSMLKDSIERTPLRRNITIDEVGNTACFLASSLASGITGEILHVDGGFNITAM